MKIILKPDIAFRLMAYAAITKLEYSGFGFCDLIEAEGGGKDIYVYDFALLNIGDPAYTEIDPIKVLPLLQREDRKKMKVWIHRHPMGNGIPGPHNWSGRDELTIRTEPLGTTPQLANWSVSIVLTLGGFVGRIDNYVKGITQHLEVEPKTANLLEEVRTLASQSPFVNSTRKPGKKSQNFPAQETSQKSKKIRVGAKKKSLRKDGTSPQKSLEQIATSMDRFLASAENLTQRKQPSRISANTTELIGAGNTAGGGMPDSEDFGDSNYATYASQFNF